MPAITRTEVATPLTSAQTLAAVAWPKATSLRWPPQYETHWSVPCRFPPRSGPRTPSWVGRDFLRRRWRSRPLAGTSTGPDPLPTSSRLPARRFQSKALLASAAPCSGRVQLAEGDAADAEQRFSEAARLWTEVGAPYETALARIGLGAALRAGGSDNRAASEAQAAGIILDRIEAPAKPEPPVPVERSRRTQGAIQRRSQRASPRGRLLVRGVRGAHRVRDLKGMRYLANSLATRGGSSTC
jgi:hypothetical protein